MSQPAKKDTICKYIISTSGFCYTVTQTLPQCNTEHAKQMRYHWAVCFHLFWEGAKLVHPRVQVLLVHIDEKLFHLLVICKFNKCVPELGCSPVFSRIHHKNSVEKVLVVCAVGFVPEGNDFCKGGAGKKISFT